MRTVLLLVFIFEVSVLTAQVSDVKVKKQNSNSWIIGQWPYKSVRISGKQMKASYGEKYIFFANHAYMLGSRESGKWEVSDSGKILRLYDRRQSGIRQDSMNYLGRVQEIRYINDNEFEAIRICNNVSVSYFFMRGFKAK